MTLTDVILLLLPFVLALLWYRKKNSPLAQIIDKIPGETRLPVIGTTINLIMCNREELFEALEKRNRKFAYNSIFRSWLGNIPVVHIRTARHFEIILKGNAHTLKAHNYRFFEPWLRKGLITAAGEKHHRHRKLLTPTFHFTILDNFQEIFSKKGIQLAEQLAQHANGRYFDAHPFVTHCALDIICETAMGVDVNAMTSSDSEYVKAVYGIGEVILRRNLTPLLHSDFIFYITKHGKEHNEHLKILHNFTAKVIKEKKEQVARGDFGGEITEEEKLLGKKKRLAFLELLLVTSKGENRLTEEELQEEVDTFMFAGHDTTSSQTNWNLFAMGNYPEIQEKVFEELDGIFHGEDREITVEDLTQMNYLNRVMKETARLFPLVPAIFRETTEDVEFDGYHIPRGTMIALNIRDLHRDPDQFPDPLKYDPDRWLPENSVGRHTFAYCPFSAGPRNCIGQKFASRNSTTLLAAILRKFRVRALNTPENVKIYSELVTKPQNGMRISLEKRY